VQKNKKAAPFSEAEIVINFDDGIDKLASILSVALALGIVTKEKGWCKYGDRRFRESQLAEVMADEPSIMEALEEARNKLVISAPSSVADDDLDEDEDGG
jgi:recombination protein RecA